MKAVIVSFVLEGAAVSAVSIPLWKTPVQTSLRIAKPVAIAVTTYLLEKLMGSSTAILLLLAQCGYGMLLHRKFCLDHGKAWINTRSPFLYRNEKQLKMWSNIASKFT